ncbi:MAG: hypothetical protein WDA16_12845 [Candidatus Thermoplasmatota archaeon]
MQGKALLVVLLFVSTGLAGCLKSADDGPKVETQSTNKTLQANETIAPDGRGAISAFNETNKTEKTGIGASMHTHDYWKGKERLEVGYLDGGLIPFPLAPCKRPDGACTAGSTTPSTDGSGDTYPVGTAIADFVLPAPPVAGMVYEGTKTVEFKLVKFTGPSTADGAPAAPANPAGQVFIDYLASNDEPGKMRHGGELKLNEPLKIDIKPTDADMPHQTKSLWVFRVYSNPEMAWFEFNITVTAVKGYDVVNWPPHPDLYAEKKDRVVFDGPVKLSSKGTVDANVWGSDAGWVHPQRVISWGTESLTIEIQNVAFSSQVPVTPSGWVFEYNNASKPPLLGHGAQYSARLKDAGTDGKSYHFAIDISHDRGDAMDTPYAQYSRWGFRLMPQFDQGAAACYDEPMPEGTFMQQFLVGCQFVPWDATYTMKIVATGRSTAEGVPASTQ